MQLHNHTRYQAGYATGILTTGQYCVVVAVKATYRITSLDDPELPLAEEQQPLHDTDGYSGEPGDSSPLYDNDFAPYKPQCDVLLPTPVAYTPHGRPATQVPVAVQIGNWRKTFRVVGPRLWERGIMTTASKPQPFTRQPLSWEIAYGGTDTVAYPEPDRVDAFLYNLVGIGYWRKPKRKYLHGSPLARTEALDQPINDPGARYLPQGFGPIARNWQPRSTYGGTYDDDWIRHTKPFLPADFDTQYYQSALPDQQIPYPEGGEIITLTHLTPEGELSFVLPRFRVPISLQTQRGQRVTLQPVVDTITIDAEARQLTLVARAHHPFIHTIHEIGDIRIGHPPVTIPFVIAKQQTDA